MKKLLFIAALMVAALFGRAQQTADSVSVMFRHLKDTNAEVVMLQKTLVKHAAMVGAGGATMLVGTLLVFNGMTSEEGTPGTDETFIKAGMAATAIGAAILCASFIPLAKKGVTLDGRGLVVRPSELRKVK